MQSQHPNIDLISKIDTNDIASNRDVFHPDVVWRFYNPAAPELAGDYQGISGVQAFFRKVQGYGGGQFTVQPKAAWAVGNELVVVQSRNRLGGGTSAVEFDVVVVWRIIDGRISEVWDIPAVMTAENAQPLPKHAAG
ncbi:MAG: nuclear transport factor 2 family protein [Pseudomonadota bacterium]